jgi:alpha-galactosidase
LALTLAAACQSKPQTTQPSGDDIKLPLQSGDTCAPPGDTHPAAGDAGCGDAMVAAGDAAPHAGDAAKPDVGDTAPHAGDSAPHAGDSALPSGDTAPQKGDDRAASDEATPGDTTPPGDSAPGADTDPTGTCGAIPLKPGPYGLGLAWPCGSATAALRPAVWVAGVWRGGGTDGACTYSSTSVTCPATGIGQVEVVLDQGQWLVRLHATADTQVRGLGLVGNVTVPDAKAFLSNGYQSWSMSGVIQIATRPTATQLATALAATGEDEVYRKGPELSWWYSFAGGAEHSFFAGATTAERLRSWLWLYRTSEPGVLDVGLVNGGVEDVTVRAGTTFDGERWQIALGQDLGGMLRRYGTALRTRRATVKTPVPAGWNSWYDLWDDVRETDLVSPSGPKNAELALQALTPRLPSSAQPFWIVLDDGWQKAWGDWQTNAKFPSGIAGLVTALHAKGLRAGLWIAPLLVKPGTPVYQQHPEWLVDNAFYTHGAHGKLSVLDVTHPDAAAYLQQLVADLRSAGIDFLKVDFLFAGALPGGRFEPITATAAYHRALQLIRDAAGEDCTIFAVGAPPVPTFPYVDGWRLGNDIAFKPLPVVNFPKPTWSFIANQARQFTSRWPLCLATLCDADPPLLRELPQNEVEAGVWVAASAAGALFLSDDLTRLPAERLDWGLDAKRVALGLSGEPAEPVSFYPDTVPTYLKSMKDDFLQFNATQYVPSLWKLKDGSCVAINFEPAPRTIGGAQVPAHTAVALPAVP